MSAGSLLYALDRLLDGDPDAAVVILRREVLRFGEIPAMRL